MNKESQPPFKIGDEVVCVDISDASKINNNKPKHVLALGEKYTITGVYKECCIWSVTVGVPAPSSTCVCKGCRRRYANRLEEWPFAASRFRKVERTYQSAIADILEKFPIREEKEIDVPIKRDIKV